MNLKDVFNKIPCEFDSEVEEVAFDGDPESIELSLSYDIDEYTYGMIKIHLCFTNTNELSLPAGKKVNSKNIPKYLLNDDYWFEVDHWSKDDKSRSLTHEVLKEDLIRFNKIIKELERIY